MFYSDSLTRVCSEKEKIVSRKFFFRRSLANKYENVRFHEISLHSVSRKTEIYLISELYKFREKCKMDAKIHQISLNTAITPMVYAKILAKC